jgi:hypothetical protein
LLLLPLLLPMMMMRRPAPCSPVVEAAAQARNWEAAPAPTASQIYLLGACVRATA